MAIIRLEDKFKSRNEIQLHPRRQYISSSSGVTGSLYVFPNRSKTQKDNIDERLDLAGNVDGEEIKPYDSNSLEARRIEIFEGNFSKFTVSPFSDAAQFEYMYQDTTDTSKNGIYTGEILNEHIFEDSTIVPTVANPIVVKAYQRIQIGANANGTLQYGLGKIYEWSSQGYWRSIDDNSVYRRIPESDRDLSAKNYEVPLAILLDGANEFTKEHAWRATAKLNGEKADLYELYQNDPTNPDYASYQQYQSLYNAGWRSGNSSFTNTSNSHLFQFSGLSVVYDELGMPYEGSPINSKSQLNCWPPEINKWDIPINTNWTLRGYSDLSMHPRNKTQKNIQLLRGNEDYFSRAMTAQRQLHDRAKNIGIESSAWEIRNYQSLCLDSYEDFSGNTKTPCLGYRNNNDIYRINWNAGDSVTFEFWVKPTKEQVSPGTICHLPDNHAIVLLPYSDSLSNGVYSRYKIGIYVQQAAAVSASPSVSDSTTAGSSNAGIYVTDAVFTLDNWSHVAIRWSEKFNNGLLSVYVDGKLETSTTEDGVFAGSRTGLVNTSLAVTSESTYTIGGWQGISFDNVWGSYAEEQNLKAITSNPPNFNTGYSIDSTFQLKSELTEFRVWNKARTIFEILQTQKKGLESITDLRCYIPFQFDPIDNVPQFSRYSWAPLGTSKNKNDYYKSAEKSTIGGTSGLLSYNKVPFCTNNAFIGGIPFVQVHSFFRELVNSNHPVITSMPNFSTDTTYIRTTDDQAYVNEFGLLKNIMNNWKSYDWLRFINSIILPCDNGSFIPSSTLNSKKLNYNQNPGKILMSGTSIGSTTSKYEIKNFLNDEVFSVDDVLSTLDPMAFATFDIDRSDGSQTSFQQYGTETLVEEEKLRDADFLSPLGIVINIPQLYYGNRIKHESIKLKFNFHKNRKQVTIVDFNGSLYRLDSTSETKCSKVGMVDYTNGILCIFNPLLTSLGIDNFDISFEGSKNMHVMQLDIPCSAGVANVSSNPGYKKLKASTNANENDGETTYISTIYLHDSNLNIVGKVNLAQPVLKREEDSFIFRVKVDF